ncbi:MAG: hypothetical protein HZC42_04360 [Candidatus Eisenbacteria bacterium]|nr:hypothetical protein [Candidatus Eisenbacteria bacterium]
MTRPAFRFALRPRLARAAAVGLLAALALLSGCSKKTPTEPGGPAHAWLGLAPNPAPGESLNAVLLTLRSTGVNLFYQYTPWDSFETAPGVYRTSLLSQLVSGVRSLGGATYVNLVIVDTNRRRLPADIAGLAFDDPALVSRLDRLVDSVLAVARRQPLLALALGNEVDVYFSQHAAEFPAFLSLYQREVGRIHSALHGLPVGISTTWDGASGSRSAWADPLNAASDLAIYTYYPFQDGTDFLHRPPSTYATDVAAMRARNPGKPYALQEVGYSSSAVNAGSDSLQADFVRRFRTHVAGSLASDLLFADWFLYTDLPAAAVDTLIAYYGFDTPGFRAYLGNLGLRHADGTPKPGWSAWVNP